MKKETRNLIIGIVIGVIVIGLIVLIINASRTRQTVITCNYPYIQVGEDCCLDENSNGICDSDESFTQNQEISESEEKKISVSELNNFVEKTIQNNFPFSSGAFFRFGSDDTCFTGFPDPCVSWIYPSQSYPSGTTTSKVLDFGKDKAPSMDRVFSAQMFFPGVEKRTLSNGKIIIQLYGPTSEDPNIHYMFEVSIPCEKQYWVTAGVSSENSINEGPFLKTANEILEYCE